MQKEIEEILNLSIDANSIVEIVKDSCEHKSYTNQQIALEYVIKVQSKILNLLFKIREV